MSVLLLGADYYGTLAAARCYGKYGIGVTMASDNPHARGLYSRHVRAKLEHPPLSEPNRLLDWLVDYGEMHPGTLLYPPNDHLAWLFAANRERIGKAFVTYAPGEETLITLLDKKRLHDACADVGIDVPETHLLGEAGADSKIVRGLRWPALLKPRTQVFLESGIKGFIVRDRKQLAAELRRFRHLMRFHDVLTSHHPDLAEPMVQEYLTAAETSIFSVSGFVTKSGELVARAAMKVLQRPRKVGIGLCFEGRPTETWLTERLAALCKRIGYHGCFEAEFIADGARRLLIDFNPRFYSQMGFDIARGLPLPMLVWHAARRDDVRLDLELARAHAWRPRGDEVYCHKTMLDLLLTLQGLAGRMSRGDVKRWRQWYENHRAAATDAVRDPDDQMPVVVDAAQWVQHFAKHPRSFVRDFVLNR
jgi:predicted ATP-grasp superfamily ATP-dependent carboligase